MAELNKLIQSAQSPQEQVQKKCARAKRLSDSLPGLMGQIRDEATAKRDAQDLVDKHAAEEIRLFDLHQWKVDEIARLNKETTEVCHERLGQAVGADQWMDREMDAKLKIFDDPVFADDSTVTEKKGELQAAAGVFRGQWVAFQTKLDFLVNHVAETREKKATDAKRKAEDDAKAAASAAKKAEEDAMATKKADEERKKKLEDDAKAANKAEDERKKKEDVETKAAKKAEEAPTVARNERGEASRSPPPNKSKSFGRGGGSSASSSKPELPKNVLDAIVKRPSDRSDAVTLLAASEAKASRKEKESWADASDAPMADNSSM